MGAFVPHGLLKRLDEAAESLLCPSLRWRADVQLTKSGRMQMRSIPLAQMCCNLERV